MKPRSISQNQNLGRTVMQLRTFLSSITFLACIVPVALSAESIQWVAAHGQWHISSNWTPTGTPNSNSEVSITNGQYQVELTNTSDDSWMTIHNLTVGAAGGNGSRLNIDFSDLTKTFNVGSDVVIGSINNAPGTLTTTNGNFSAQTVTLGGGGNQNFSKGTWNINGGVNTIRATSGYGLRLGAIGTGILNVTGGELNVLSSAIAVGSNGFQAAQMSVSGGTVTAHTIYVGPGTHANQVQNSLNISGGTTKVNTQFTIGRYANSNGIVTLTGGELDASGATTYIGKAETTTNASQGTLTVDDGDLSLGLTYIGYNASGKGTWNINGGNNSVNNTLRLGHNTGSEGSVIMNGGTLDVDATMIVGVNGSGSVELNGGTMSVNTLQVMNGSSSSFTFNGGTLSTGGTTVNNGNVFTVGNGSDAAHLVLGDHNHSFADGLVLTNNATLSGIGTITAGALVVSSGATLSPGNSPGSLTLGDTTLNGGAQLNWQIHDASGEAGFGYDVIHLNDGAVLTIGDTGAAPVNVNVWSLMSIYPDVNGDAVNFDSTSNYSWTLFSTEELIEGYSADAFVVNLTPENGTGGFSNAFDGIFEVVLSDGGTDLVLRYTAIPEPSVFAVVLGILGTSITILRRRQRM